MKRWALLTVLFYGLALLLLGVPVIYWAAGEWDLAAGLRWTPDSGALKFLEVYREWGFWLWLAIMLLGQLLLLLVPMDLVRARPVSRRKVLVPVVVAAFFAAQLLFAGIFCLLFMQYGDHAPDKILFWTNWGLGEATGESIQEAATEFFGVTISGYDRTMLGGASLVLTLWVIWTLVFYRFSRNIPPEALVRRLVRWLLAGSILEFLVAVPSHIVVRGREDCCAPVGTFWGIACGIAVMLLAFGPGVFFLFVERFRRLRPRIDDRPPAG